MAKLNGVKTVDMVNGEITKVAYDGAEYEVIGADNSVMPNDIVRINSNNIWDGTKGAFYAVGNDGEYRDNDGDLRDPNFGSLREDYDGFRKIAVQTPPSLEVRVAELETEVAALKGEASVEPKRLTVGDKAKIIGEASLHSGNVGDIVEIKVDANDHQPYKCKRISDGKDVGWFFVEDLVAYTDETITFEGETYRKVDREAREGDVVIFTDATADRHFITKNMPYKAVDNGGFVDSEGDHMEIYANDCGQNRTRKTVDVYAPVATPYEPKVGDYIYITNNRKVGFCSPHFGKVGDVTKVKSVLTDRVETELGFIMTELYRKATPAEIEAYEKAAHKASFAVGDYVKIVKSYRGYEGETAKILEIGEFITCKGIADFRIEHLPKKDGQYAVKAEQIVKATNEEIAKAKAPKLKAGDFVKFTDSTLMSSVTLGKVYELHARTSGALFVDTPLGECTAVGKGGTVYGAPKLVSADEAKWAKLGRKVNEFKVGDVVRAKRKDYEGYGTIEDAYNSDRNYGVRFANGDFRAFFVGEGHTVELIAPVDAVLMQ